MGELNIQTTELRGVRVITPAAFSDHRGFSEEIYSDRDFKAVGIDFNFIRDNQPLSTHAGVLRGLHSQWGKVARTKLIRVATDAVLDVTVGLRKGSPAYEQWEGYILSTSNHRQLLVPRGFAHGLLTLTDNINFIYKCGNYYDVEVDGGISPKTPGSNIDWPIKFNKAIISEKDAVQPTLTEFEKNNSFVYSEV